MSGEATGRGLWWATPAGIILFVVPVSMLLAVNTTDLEFRQLYRVPKALTSTEVVLMLLAAGLLLIGALLPLGLRRSGWSAAWPGLDAAQLRTLDRGATVCFWLTVAGYLAFGLAGVARGATAGQLLATLAAQDNYSGGLKETFAPVTGITTLTQVGIAYVVLAAVLISCGAGTRVRRRIAIVLALSVLRAFFLTERLAVLEVVVPLVLVLAVTRRRSGRRSWWLPAAPALGLPLLIAAFGLFEYSRSWTYFRSRTTSSFPEFVVDRLAGYYSTSYNNGAIELQNRETLGDLPYATLEGFWTAPGISQLNLYERLTGVRSGEQFALLLEQYGSPEFNNPGGLSLTMVEFGTSTGLLLMFLIGIGIGLAHRSFRAGSLTGLLLYPVLFTGLLELPRYFYWTQGRLVPALLALIFILYRLRRVQRPGLQDPPADVPVPEQSQREPVAAMA